MDATKNTPSRQIRDARLAKAIAAFDAARNEYLSLVEARRAASAEESRLGQSASLAFDAMLTRERRLKAILERRPGTVIAAGGKIYSKELLGEDLVPDVLQLATA